MAKVVPLEIGVVDETPPPGWVQPDEPEGPPALDEEANEEFLEASRKARAEALARRGKRRYNLALRVVGFFVIFNMIVCCVPLLDNIYTLSWIRVSGAFVRYAMNHHSIVDSRGEGFAPYEHYRVQYEAYDTSCK